MKRQWLRPSSEFNLSLAGGWIRDNMERIFVRIECHVENTSGGRKDNRSFGVRGFQTRFLLPSPPLPSLPMEGEEIRDAICHPPIVCLSSTAILIPKRTNFVILGRFYFPPEADCGDAVRRQFPNSNLTKSPFLRKLRYPSNTVRDERTWTSESLRNVLHAREIEDIRFSIATLVRLVLFLPPSLLTPLFPLE